MTLRKPQWRYTPLVDEVIDELDSAGHAGLRWTIVGDINTQLFASLEGAVAAAGKESHTNQFWDKCDSFCCISVENERRQTKGTDYSDFF